MKLNDFIKHEKIKQIANNIKKRSDFIFRNEVNGYELRIRDGRAACDWSGETKEGDYYISIGFQTKDRGNGIPLSGSELDNIGSVEGLTEYLDNYMGNNNIKDYKTLDEGQIDIFNFTMQL